MKNWTNIIMLKGLLSKNWALLKSDHFGIEIIPDDGWDEEYLRC